LLERFLTLYTICHGNSNYVTNIYYNVQNTTCIVTSISTKNRKAAKQYQTTPPHKPPNVQLVKFVHNTSKNFSNPFFEDFYTLYFITSSLMIIGCWFNCCAAKMTHGSHVCCMEVFI